MASLSNILRHSIPKILKTRVNPVRFLTNTVPSLAKKEIEITFVRHDGTTIKTMGTVGDTFLNTVVKTGIDLEGYGVCEGTLTCSTCHLIFKKEDYDRLPGEVTDEEIDMLELAQDTSETSRLGCQVCLTEDMDGIVVTVPEIVSDIYERLPNK